MRDSQRVETSAERSAPGGGLPRQTAGPRYSGLVLLLVVLAGAGPRAQPVPAAPPPAPPIAQPGAAAAPAPTAPSPMDQPLALIHAADKSYRGVRDYTCLFVKRERVRGQMQPEHLINMSVRTQPFSVHLYWLGPKQFARQEVCYVAGRNNGMMRVRTNGLLGAVGFVSLSPTDPRALESSRHTITEAGIGNLIEQFARGWEGERRLNRTQVQVADYEYNKRLCTRVETIHPDAAGGQLIFYRSVVYFDKQNHLPIRVENYDWPRAGSPEGELLESYSYANLRLNVGLSDDLFNR